MSTKNLGIYRRGAVYWLSWTIGGKRYRESLQTTDENEAAQRAIEWKSQPGLLLSRQLEREIDDYLADRQALGKLREVTAYTRKKILEAFCEASGCQALHDLTTPVIQRWYEQRKGEVQLCTADLHLKAVRAFCRWLVDKGRIRLSPAAKVRPQTNFTPARVEFCDAATVDRLIAAAPDLDFEFILLAGFDAGFRRNEIVQARRDWFNLDAGSISIRQTATFKPKNSRGRTVPLTARFLAFLRKHHANLPADSFILSPDEVATSKYQPRVSINAAFNAFTETHGAPWVHPHTMRRTFASLRVSAGVSIYKVSAWLGDRLATTERHYAHLVPVDDEIERIHRSKPMNTETESK